MWKQASISLPVSFGTLSPFYWHFLEHFPWSPEIQGPWHLHSKSQPQRTTCLHHRQAWLLSSLLWKQHRSWKTGLHTVSCLHTKTARIWQYSSTSIQWKQCRVCQWNKWAGRATTIHIISGAAANSWPWPKSQKRVKFSYIHARNNLPAGHRFPEDLRKSNTCQNKRDKQPVKSCICKAGKSGRRLVSVIPNGITT